MVTRAIAYPVGDNTSSPNHFKLNNVDCTISVFHFSLSAALKLVNRHGSNNNKADNDLLQKVICA